MLSPFIPVLQVWIVGIAVGLLLVSACIHFQLKFPWQQHALLTDGLPFLLHSATTQVGQQVSPDCVPRICQFPQRCVGVPHPGDPQVGGCFGRLCAVHAERLSMQRVT